MDTTASLNGDDAEFFDDGPLSGVEFINGEFVSGFDAEAEEQSASRARFAEAVERIATPERLHDVLRLLYRWTGRALKVSSLEIDKNDSDFREACDLLHDDLKDSFLGPILDDLDTETLHRLLVYGVGFGMPIVRASQEVTERKREAASKALEKDDNETQGDDENEDASGRD